MLLSSVLSAPVLSHDACCDSEQLSASAATYRGQWWNGAPLGDQILQLLLIGGVAFK